MAAPLPPEEDRRRLDAWVAGQAAGLSKAQVAKSLGLAPNAFTTWLANLEARRNAVRPVDPAVQAAMDRIGMAVVPTSGWLKTEPDENGLSASLHFRIDPEPAENLIDRLAAAFADVRPVEPLQPPAHVMEDLCTVYPLMDAHVGMQAWGRETGGLDYDLQLAEMDMRSAFQKVAAMTPAADTAILIVGGDYFHQDDNRAETPANKHKLDVDGRHWKVLDAGIAMLVDAIETLRAKHAHVILRVLRGNHDEHSHLVLSFALAERYREEPRVTVEKTPRDLFMFEWGRSAIFAHHGDKGKPQQLAGYISDICPFWSATRHRYFLTGHIHQDSSKEFPGLRWESLRAFCPPDSYAASMGYSGRRALQSMTFSAESGLVLRAIDPIERREAVPFRAHPGKSRKA